MEKNIDLMCYNFTQDLVKLVNESGLPLSVIGLLLKDVLLQIDQEKNNNIMKALQEKESKEENKED